MTQIEQLLGEVRFEMLKVIILNAFLEGIILFLALVLLVSFFGMGLLVPLVLTLLFFSLRVISRWRRFQLVVIEDRNPEVREMLRTAADNKDEETLMSQALFADVINRMRRVSSGTFLDFSPILAKIGVMFALSIVLVSLAYFNVNIQKFDNPLPAIRNNLAEYFPDLGFGDGSLEDANLDLADEYGEPSIAQLGNQELDITLQQNLNQIDFTSINDADPSSVDDLNDYPVDVSAEASAAYTGGLEDVTDRKTAAEYSQRIK